MDIAIIGSFLSYQNSTIGQYLTFSLNNSKYKLTVCLDSWIFYTFLFLLQNRRPGSLSVHQHLCTHKITHPHAVLGQAFVTNYMKFNFGRNRKEGTTMRRRCNQSSESSSALKVSFAREMNKIT